MSEKIYVHFKICCEKKKTIFFHFTLCVCVCACAETYVRVEDGRHTIFPIKISN